MQPSPTTSIAVSLLLVTALASANAADAQNPASNPPSVRIERQILEIKKEPDYTNRWVLTQRMAYSLNRPGNLEIDSQTIDDVATLLGDEGDRVRYWAAEALANIGPPARRAIPMLESAFRKGIEYMTNFGSPIILGIISPDAICKAYEKIGASDAPKGCSHGMFNTDLYLAP